MSELQRSCLLCIEVRRRAGAGRGTGWRPGSGCDISLKVNTACFMLALNVVLLSLAWVSIVIGIIIVVIISILGIILLLLRLEPRLVHW